MSRSLSDFMALVNRRKHFGAAAWVYHQEGDRTLAAYLRFNTYYKRIEVGSVALEREAGEGPHRSGLFRNFMLQLEAICREKAFSLYVENVLSPSLGPRLERAGFTLTPLGHPSLPCYEKSCETMSRSSGMIPNRNITSSAMTSSAS